MKFSCESQKRSFIYRAHLAGKTAKQIAAATGLTIAHCIEMGIKERKRIKKGKDTIAAKIVLTDDLIRIRRKTLQRFKTKKPHIALAALIKENDVELPTDHVGPDFKHHHKTKSYFNYILRIT